MGQSFPLCNGAAEMQLEADKELRSVSADSVESFVKILGRGHPPPCLVMEELFATMSTTYTREYNSRWWRKDGMPQDFSPDHF